MFRGIAPSLGDAVPRLFVSCSYVDQDLVEQTIAPYYDAAGVEVWYARRNMVASQDFNLKILEQLRQSDSSLARWRRLRFAATGSFGSGTPGAQPSLQACPFQPSAVA
ncbi:MAG: hypothetical protein RL885_01775 [Planctomycetota bacterium]